MPSFVGPRIHGTEVREANLSGLMVLSANLSPTILYIFERIDIYILQGLKPKNKREVYKRLVSETSILLLTEGLALRETLFMSRQKRISIKQKTGLVVKGNIVMMTPIEQQETITTSLKTHAPNCCLDLMII